MVLIMKTVTAIIEKIPGFVEAKKEAQKLSAKLNAEVNFGEQR